METFEEYIVRLAKEQGVNIDTDKMSESLKAIRQADDTATETRMIIDEFNVMLRKKGAVAYDWLRDRHNKQKEDFFEKYGYPLNNDFMYLYPERLEIVEISNTTIIEKIL